LFGPSNKCRLVGVLIIANDILANLSGSDTRPQIEGHYPASKAVVGRIVSVSVSVGVPPHARNDGREIGLDGFERTVMKIEAGVEGHQGETIEVGR
jgi:hypothetical protein